MSRPDEGPGCLLHIAYGLAIIWVITSGLRLILMMLGYQE